VPIVDPAITLHSENAVPSAAQSSASLHLLQATRILGDAVHEQFIEISAHGLHASSLPLISLIVSGGHCSQFCSS
jgi:hypothetical protein